LSNKGERRPVLDTYEQTHSRLSEPDTQEPGGLVKHQGGEMDGRFFSGIRAGMPKEANPASAPLPPASMSGSSEEEQQALIQISGSATPGIIEHILARPTEGAQDGRVHISILYPSIGRTDVDADIRTWVAEIADSFERTFDSEDYSMEVTSAGLGDPDRIDLHGDFRISRTRKAVSVIFELWNCVGTGPANLDVITLNYSMINGQRLGLADMFARPHEALKLMSEWCRAELSNRYGLCRTQMMERGTEALVENFSSLMFTPSGITIFFQPYQVAQGDLGVQTVEMPLEKLSSAEPFLAFWGK